MAKSIDPEITEGKLAAYDSPFPARIYMAGVRKFPSLVNTVGHTPTNEAARAALDAFDRPVLGMFGLQDFIFGDEATGNAAGVAIAGAAGQPHKDYSKDGLFQRRSVLPGLGACQNQAMTAYLIADTDVHDPVSYEQYKALARPIAEKFGGEYLVRGGELRVDDDDLWSPTRLVIISFPDRSSANAFLDSDEYAPVKEMRRQYAKSTVVMVDGGTPG